MKIAVLLLNGFRQALNVIPKEYYFEIENEVTKTNIGRIKALSALLVAMNMLMVFVDITVYYPNWNANINYVNLFNAHLFMILERALYLTILHIMSTKTISLNQKLNQWLILYSCMVGLLWGSYLSVNAQGIHGQISAFIISSFAIASTVLLMPKQSILIFTGNSAFFVVLLYNTPLKYGNFISNAINALFVLSFSFLMSYINIQLYSKNYLHKKTIQLQALELASSRDQLEEMVVTRTEELVKTNEQLIKEMAIRHDIEIQSIKTRLMYEENTLLLNQIKEYEELRKVFFANLSHELRTPLNVIFSAQQMIDFIINKQQTDGSQESISKYNKIVKQNCYRLLRLISNLIDITKIDANYFEISKKNCDIVKIVENITQSVAIYIRDKHIELNFETEVKEAVIACDPDKVERIMLNLLSNAVKFTPEKGQINVHVSVVEGYIAISVKDTGIGITKEMQPLIFERFIQADKSMARNREGSGIGLSLVKSLMDLHQGKICLVSEQGKGSEFIIEFPLELLPIEKCTACTCEDNNQYIERIYIEFSDIYS